MLISFFQTKLLFYLCFVYFHKNFPFFFSLLPTSLFTCITIQLRVRKQSGSHSSFIAKKQQGIGLFSCCVWQKNKMRQLVEIKKLIFIFNSQISFLNLFRIQTLKKLSGNNPEKKRNIEIALKSVARRFENKKSC